MMPSQVMPLSLPEASPFGAKAMDHAAGTANTRPSSVEQTEMISVLLRYLT